MKLQIGLNVHPLNGYTTVDPIPGEGKLLRDFRNLNDIVEDSECTEIIGESVLDYLQSNEIAEVIEHWVSKLRQGGKIVLGGTELFEVARKVHMLEFTVSEANRLLYGQEPCHKRGQYTLGDVITAFSRAGLKITKKRLDGIYFLVEGHRE